MKMVPWASTVCGVYMVSSALASKARCHGERCAMRSKNAGAVALLCFWKVKPPFIAFISAVSAGEVTVTSCVEDATEKVDESNELSHECCL